MKPLPQSEAVWQGSRYLGTHECVVVVVQGSGGGVGSGAGHVAPGGQAGEVATVPGQLSLVCA